MTSCLGLAALRFSLLQRAQDSLVSVHPHTGLQSFIIDASQIKSLKTAQIVTWLPGPRRRPGDMSPRGCLAQSLQANLPHAAMDPCIREVESDISLRNIPCLANDGYSAAVTQT